MLRAIDFASTWPALDQATGSSEHGDTVATLMIRHLHRDRDQIVRHVVREVRDEAETRLAYDTRRPDACSTTTAGSTAAHSRSLHLSAADAAIGTLPGGQWSRWKGVMADACERRRMSPKIEPTPKRHPWPAAARASAYPVRRRLTLAAIGPAGE
jgi:hypothetical protein